MSSGYGRPTPIASPIPAGGSLTCYSSSSSSWFSRELDFTDIEQLPLPTIFPGNVELQIPLVRYPSFTLEDVDDPFKFALSEISLDDMNLTLWVHPQSRMTKLAKYDFTSQPCYVFVEAPELRHISPTRQTSGPNQRRPIWCYHPSLLHPPSPPLRCTFLARACREILSSSSPSRLLEIYARRFRYDGGRNRPVFNGPGLLVYNDGIWAGTRTQPASSTQA